MYNVNFSAVFKMSFFVLKAFTSDKKPNIFFKIIKKII